MFGNNGRKFIITLPTTFHGEQMSLSLLIFAFTILSAFSVVGRCFLEDCPQFWGLFRLSLLERPHYDFRLSCVTQKEETVKSWERTFRFQVPHIQDGGPFSLLMVDVGLFVVGAWQVAIVFYLI